MRKKDERGEAKKGVIPGWLQIRIDNNLATAKEKTLYKKLLKEGKTKGAPSAKEVCPGCQSTSICPGGCVGGCQSAQTGGCTTSCLLPGLKS
jgi:hypothetical protein